MVAQIESEKTSTFNGRELLRYLINLFKRKMKPPIISRHPQEPTPTALKEIGVTARGGESAPLNLETEIDNFKVIIYKCSQIIIDAIPTDSNIQEDTYFITLYSSSSANRATKELAALTEISDQSNPFRKRPAIFAVTILWNIANGLKAEVFSQPSFDLPDHMISFINNLDIDSTSTQGKQIIQTMRIAISDLNSFSPQSTEPPLNPVRLQPAEQEASLSLPGLLTRIVKNNTVKEASSSQGVIKNTLNLVVALYFGIPHIENMNNFIKKSNYYKGFYKDNNHQGSPGIVAYLGKDLQEFVFYLRQKGNSNLARDEITIDL